MPSMRFPGKDKDGKLRENSPLVCGGEICG